MVSPNDDNDDDDDDNDEDDGGDDSESGGDCSYLAKDLLLQADGSAAQNLDNTKT